MEAAGDRPELPALSLRIQKLRKEKQEEWTRQHKTRSGNPYTQEAVARKMKMSLSGYGNLERGQSEWKRLRLEQVAVALDLDPDYFLPTGDLASATARVEAEADRWAELRPQFEELLELLRSLAQAQAQLGSPNEPG